MTKQVYRRSFSIVRQSSRQLHRPCRDCSPLWGSGCQALCSDCIRPHTSSFVCSDSLPFGFASPNTQNIQSLVLLGSPAASSELASPHWRTSFGLLPPRRCRTRNSTQDFHLRKLRLNLRSVMASEIGIVRDSRIRMKIANCKTLIELQLATCIILLQSNRVTYCEGLNSYIGQWFLMKYLESLIGLYCEVQIWTASYQSHIPWSSQYGIFFCQY